MVEARSPDLLPHLTFRSQSGTGRCQEQRVEILIEAPGWALQPQLRVAVKVRFLVPRRALLPVGTQASCAASVFPLLFMPIRICQFFWFFLRSLSDAISSSPLSVSVSVYAAALIWVKWWARAAPAAWPMTLPLPFRRISSLSSMTWRLLVLQRGSESSLVLEKMRRVTRWCRIYRPGFVVLQ